MSSEEVWVGKNVPYAEMEICTSAVFWWCLEENLSCVVWSDFRLVLVLSPSCFCGVFRILKFCVQVMPFITCAFAVSWHLNCCPQNWDLARITVAEAGVVFQLEKYRV